MFKRNAAVNGFSFSLISINNGSDVTTGTVTAYYKLDNGSQLAMSNTATHQGEGQWAIDILAAEMNGEMVALLFKHADAVPVSFTIKTDTSIPSDVPGEVWEELTASHGTADTFGEKVGQKILTTAKWLGLRK